MPQDDRDAEAPEPVEPTASARGRGRPRKGEGRDHREERKFPRILGALRESRGYSQSELSTSLEMTPAYLSQLATGSKVPRPETIDRLATALDLSEEETRKLHLAAARDMGFRLDLPDDF
ncbi:helix-turn-helix domain-containing protein [Paracoccus tibetensis]|uniref:Helix-turn-helix domain-containing protein n=1 Tax=Paracoccus tibetensis TaxID=336292 RepID=A0A1G5DAJ6_9RHOB|nr:helix-turn-helix transcriptional regulator [Paracoccus tibetensis]SCY11626.1 Helix-turn-helix domain-containing protein [Paracoccus tibetensis]